MRDIPVSNILSVTDRCSSMELFNLQ